MVIVEVPFNVFLDRNPHLKNRPLNEQYVHYNDYLQVIHLQQQSNITRGGGTDFLQQENLFDILQEDGFSRILVTN